MGNKGKEVETGKTHVNNTINTNITADIYDTQNANTVMTDVNKDILQSGVKNADNKTSGKAKKKKAEAEGRVIKAGQLTRKQLRKQEIRRIRRYETQQNDYEKYGVGFDLEHVDINAIDSRYMRKLKIALRLYLNRRKEIFEKRDLKEKDYVDEIDRLDKKKPAESKEKSAEKGDTVSNFISISAAEQEELALLYARVNRYTDDYLDHRDKMFKFGRGRKRRSQVERIKELLNNDNRRFFLSVNRRELLGSTDMEDKQKMSGLLFPSYLNAVLISDKISDRNQAYRDRRRRQRSEKNLPSLFSRHNEWWKTAMINNGWRLAMGYHAIGGLIDRTLGTATMIAANSLTLVGKTVKIPLKILSLGFNLVLKPFTKKRWNVEYSLTKGWSDTDEGRKIFRDCAKGLAALPTAMAESVVKGFPYLFRKMRGTADKDKKVYSITAALTKNLRSRIRKNIEGLGFAHGKDKYGLKGKEYASQNLEDIAQIKDAAAKKDAANKKDVAGKKVAAGIEDINNVDDVIKKKYIANDSPELIQSLEAERKIYTPADYPEETKAHYEALLQGKNYAVPRDLIDLTNIRSRYMELRYFYKTNSKGDIYEAGDYFWKEDTDPEFREAYDWLVGYYRAHSEDIKGPDPIPYNEKATAPLKGEHTPYEYQGHTLYCWACTMNGLMNEYAGHKVSDLGMVRNSPLNIPSFEESGFEDRAKYNEGVNLANRMHTGNATGNPAIFGDYILGKLPDTAVCSAHIGIAPGRRDFCKRRFLETLGTRLEKGPVGLLFANHFVLVYGIDGDNLKVRDSNTADPDKLDDYIYTASDIFSSNAHEVELVWLENVRGKEQEIARDFTLEYHEENRTFGGAVNREKETILHRNGIEGVKAAADGDLVSYQIYVPKHLGVQGVAGEPQPQQPAQAENVQEQKQEQRPAQAENVQEQKQEQQPAQVENVQEQKQEQEQQAAQAENVQEQEQKQEQQAAQAENVQEQKQEQQAVQAENVQEQKQEQQPAQVENTQKQQNLEQIDEESEEEEEDPKSDNLAKDESTQMNIDSLKATDEEFENAFSKDLVAERLNSKALMQDNEIFKERFFEEPISDEVFGTRVEKAHKTIHKKTALSSARKADQIKVAKERLSIQKRLRRDQLQIVEKRQNERKKIKERFYHIDAAELSRQFKTDIGKEVVQNWIIRETETKKGKKEFVERHLVDCDRSAGHRWKAQLSVLDEVGDMDISEYEYSSDEEFVSKFEAGYEKLVKASSARAFLDKFYNDTGHEVPDRSIAMIEAKIEMFSQLRKEYEDRMALISSPYYLLIADEDLSAYKGRKGAEKLKKSGFDEGLQEYISLYLNLSKNKSGKARSHAEVFDDILKRTQQKYAERDCNKMQDLMKGIDLKDKTVDKDGKVAVMNEMYDQKNAFLMESLPENDTEFLEGFEVEGRGVLIDHLDRRDLRKVERIVLGIINDGQICGQKIAAKHRAKIGVAIRKFMRLRRKAYSAGETLLALSSLAVGMDYDLFNPEFLKTKEGRLAASLKLDDDVVPTEITDRVGEPLSVYALAMFELFYLIKNLGYKLHESEDISDKDARKALLKDRKDYTYEYHIENGLEPFDMKKGVPMKHPVFTVNGQQITAYNSKSKVMKMLRNKQFTVKSKNAGEIIQLLKEYSDLQRELIVNEFSRTIFFGVGGYFGRVKERILNEKMEPLRKRIEELLDSGELEEINAPGEKQQKKKTKVEKQQKIQEASVFADAAGGMQ